ncbi:MAG: response regulator [Blastocatellia bacterium]
MIVSGIEPIDELLGGLERGELYLVHGEASGKSLFGIKFLIEGLKRGENGALVIRYPPEDAVRRFALLGYDCLEDVYSGRLVILEYSDDIIQRIGKLRELTPVLRELEWLLGETRPQRLIFDPVTSVLTGVEGNLEAPALDFAEWARSFGATVILANDSNTEVTASFTPLVAESFRFYVKEAGEGTIRFLAFEKSSTVPDQAIEVDPSRGVFLLGRAYDAEVVDAHPAVPNPPSIAELDSIRKELLSGSDKPQEAEAEPSPHVGSSSHPDRTVEASESAQVESSLQAEILTQAEKGEAGIEPVDSLSIDESGPLEELLGSDSQAKPLAETEQYELSDLLDDLSDIAAPLKLDLLEEGRAVSWRVEPQEREAAEGPRESHEAFSSIHKSDKSQRPAGSRRRDVDVDSQSQPRQRRRAADFRIDSAMASRAGELLILPPEEVPEEVSSSRATQLANEVVPPEPSDNTEVRTKDFNVLIIEDDNETSEIITQTLNEYTLEIVNDGVSGLARLISFKPDLVVLDFDLPIIDGFKVLTLIRSVLNVPIVIISGTRIRALDRVMAAELGADYYLTKPFSPKELKHKARQLIARYRGIRSWIVKPANTSPVKASDRIATAPVSVGSNDELSAAYKNFSAEVEKRIRTALDGSTPFSIVGCRFRSMNANGERRAVRLFEIVRGLMRETDLTSANEQNDLLVLLADADTAGARAFAGRLRQVVIAELDQAPLLWMRSFPDLEGSTEVTPPGPSPAHERTLDRRSSDRRRYVQPKSGSRLRLREGSTGKSDPRDSYLDFLESL